MALGSSRLRLLFLVFILVGGVVISSHELSQEAHGDTICLSIGSTNHHELASATTTTKDTERITIIVFFLFLILFLLSVLLLVFLLGLGLLLHLLTLLFTNVLHRPNVDVACELG